MTIEETLQLVRAGFTADQIQQLMQQGQQPAPAPTPVTPPVIPQAPAPIQQTDPAPAPTPEPDPEPEKTEEKQMDPAIQKILDDQAAQIANLQQIIASSNNMGGLARQETDPMAYLVKTYSSK